MNKIKFLKALYGLFIVIPLCFLIITLFIIAVSLISLILSGLILIISPLLGLIITLIIAEELIDEYKGENND